MPRIIIVVALLGLSLTTGWTLANSTGMSRQEIRNMPIQTRPNRPGHFYGNTVRRMTQRREGGLPTPQTDASPRAGFGF